MLRLSNTALTFDDVLLVPDYSDILPKDVDLKTQLTSSLSLNIPLLSAAMDTVTESRMSIALSEQGGIGIIHKNLSNEAQASEVRRVKKYESGIVRDPITIRSDNLVGELIQLTNELKISGMPVVDDGQLVGIVTSRDFRNEQNASAKVAEIMTPKEKLITAQEGEKLDEIKRLLQDNRIEKILLVDSDFTLTGLVTLKDINKSLDFPNAARDEEGRLLVGAAIGTKKDTMDRAEALIKAGVDVLVVDSAHGHSEGVLEQIRQIKSHYKDIQVIGGNVATAEGALALVKAGVDAVKVGIGPGSVCTTRLQTGVGYPQLSAVMECADAAHGLGAHIIADGGCTCPGDVAKGFGAGADFVMLGGMFAGHDEGKGKIIKTNGKKYIEFYGTSSTIANKKHYGGLSDYRSSEGRTVRVKYRGKIRDTILNILGGVRSSCTYVGAPSLKQLSKCTTFVRVSNQFNETFVD